MSKLKKGDVVTVMTGVGEYIARLVEITPAGVDVENPRLIVKWFAVFVVHVRGVLRVLGHEVLHVLGHGVFPILGHGVLHVLGHGVLVHGVPYTCFAMHCR